ncbi:hypothetical protein B5C34_15430 [Pacificimonas flava]|uniref:Outer membrane protein W n=2 Tax=Pacificimonas TaxID=1960290 RepID=A0A219B2B6_9SPHN|nr:MULTISPECIES: OmpW family outer membrane protein [Pacificimonas]MBZ6379644.1 OmpW family protein [Pacificimonas aurantium]OWV31968.1 hypothetical protein B5C34_15430 [Pacificimonas flava]
MKALSLPIILATLAAGAVPTAASAEAGDVLLRVRGIYVTPTEDSGDILPAFPGETVSLTDAVAPEFDLTYMATDNVGIELIAATTKHQADGVTGVTGGLGDLVETWVLPPTVTLQYHFAPNSKVRPYVGAGLNYTFFWDEEAQDPLTNAVGPTKVTLSDSFGWALQAGVDIDLNERFFLNLDAKYIDMNTDVELDTTAAGMQTIDVDVNPFVFGVGFGIRL